MAAILMNSEMKGLCDHVLLMQSLLKDESNLQCLKGDILSGFISKNSLHILSKALTEMPGDRSLHSYIIGSKVVFPAFQKKIIEVECNILL
jgi:hypothetical protein